MILRMKYKLKNSYLINLQIIGITESFKKKKEYLLTTYSDS